MGRNFDPAMFDNPEVRFAVLDQVVNEHLLTGKARDEKFRVSDAQLRDVIASIPAFQDGGKFSPERYELYLAGQSTNRLAFEDKLRRDMLAAAVQEPIAAANVVARPSTEKFLGLLEQQREVAIAVVNAEPFVKDVKVDEAEVKTFYDNNQAAFQTPELARIEYLVLTADALLGGTTVDAAEVKKQYDSNIAQYSTPEQRTVAHVLVPVKPDANEADRAAAGSRPRSRSPRPKRHRPNSATGPGNSRKIRVPRSRGDLGTFARGTMVKAFEDAAFAAKRQVTSWVPCQRSSAGTSSR